MVVSKALREEHRRKVYENRVLRRIGPKECGLTGKEKKTAY
jgi:hypothetical protein